MNEWILIGVFAFAVGMMLLSAWEATHIGK